MRFDQPLGLGYEGGNSLQQTPPQASMGFVNPMPGTGAPGPDGSFGAARTGYTHQGVDLAYGGAGTPVRAAGAGTARWSNSPNGGWTLHIYHANGWVTKYMHLGTIDNERFTDRRGKAGGTIQPYAVRDGQQVSAGQVIGYQGDTGNPDAGAYHLHFEMWHDGTPVDPMSTGFMAGRVNWDEVDQESLTQDSMLTAPDRQAASDQLRSLLGVMLSTASRVTAGPTGRMTHNDLLMLRQQQLAAQGGEQIGETESQGGL